MAVQQCRIREGDTVKWSGNPADVEYVDRDEGIAGVIVDSACKTTHGFREVDLSALELS